MTDSLIERRRFLQTSLVAGGAAVALPTMFAEQAAAAQATSNTILLTVTLAGGNDGLNTVGPFASGRYRDLRGPLAIAAGQGHSAGDNQMFHPNLRRLATRYRRGDVAVVSGVGDPGLDHSHFSNLARWQSGRSDGGIGRTGWLGRWLDGAGGTDFTGIAIGGQGVPLHMRGSSASVTDLPRNGGALYGSDTSERRDRVMFNRIDRLSRTTREWPWVDEVAQTNAFAVSSAGSVAPAYNGTLPEDRLHRDLLLSARLINLNLGARVLNVWHSGYDTHDQQVGSSATEGDHADLLDSLDTGLDAFFSSLNATMADRVVVLVYSEFGRRVEPNDSRGTDHGTSSSVFVIGRQVRGGMYGGIPSLNSLDNRGDLQVTTDFRRVYSTLVADWLQSDPAQILGRSYNSLGFIQAAAGPAPDTGDLRGRANQIRDRRTGTRSDYLEYHSPRF